MFPPYLRKTFGRVTPHVIDGLIIHTPFIVFMANMEANLNLLSSHILQDWVFIQAIEFSLQKLDQPNPRSDTPSRQRHKSLESGNLCVIPLMHATRESLFEKNEYVVQTPHSKTPPLESA